MKTIVLPKTSVKMRAMTWTKLPARLVKGSVWADIGDDEEMVKGMEDGDVFKELEKFFGAADKVTLLDGERANNISISLAQFRISFLDIKVCARIQTVGTTSVMHGF